MKIWIFLPAYNEEESLRRLFPKLRLFREQYSSYEVAILVLDDGSDDNTSEISKEEMAHQNVVLIRHSINRGLGETERDGFEYLAQHCADNDIIIRLDCDDTHEPQYIQSMIDKIAEGYSVVNTSRFQPGGYQRGVNWYRRAISRSANIFMKLMFGLDGMRDYSCGFRAYRADIIKDAVRVFGNGFLQMRGFGFTSTLEIIVKLHLLGSKFAEVPFGLRYDQKASESKMVSSMTMLGYIIMALLYHYPFSGWRTWRKKLIQARSESTDAAIETFSDIRRGKSIPSRFGS